jgi:hypothetical protein
MMTTFSLSFKNLLEDWHTSKAGKEQKNVYSEKPGTQERDQVKNYLYRGHGRRSGGNIFLPV